MIPAPLSLISRTLLLGDIHVLEKLMQGLLAGNIQSADLIQNWHIATAIEARYPRLYRANEAELATKKHSGIDLSWLETLFDEYYRFNGDYIIAREERRMDYAQLCAQIHPALPVAWKLSALVNPHDDYGQLAVDDLLRIIDATSCNFLPLPNTNRIWADLHVHQGGAMETSLNLFSLVFNSCKPPEKTQTLPSADYDHAVLKQHNQWQTTYQTLFRILLNSVVPEEFDWQTHIASLDLAWRLGHVGRPVIKPGAWLNLNMPAADHTAQQLAYSALNNYHQGKFQLGWLYWLTALFLMYRQPHANPNQKACILAFLHLAQLFRRDMIHDGVGLKRFVRYFDNPVRKIASEQHRDQDSLHQLLGEENQWAELKITEWIADKSAALRFINTSCTQLGKGKLNINNTELNKFLARTHTCIHFIRIPSQIPHTARRIKALAENLGSGT